MASTALRICPLCEATCGLELTIDDDAARVTHARGDRADVFSAGYLCPKGAGFPELDNDPDRLQRPLLRRSDGFVEVEWSEAFDEVERRLTEIIERHGGPAVGVYLGNPGAHSIAGALFSPLLIRALGTHQRYSASTLDQMPKQAALGHMYGSAATFTVPDIDRTDHLVIIGANPLVSNGSLATAADFPGKLRALRRRGGRLTVIDPARTRTAKIADVHLAPRPGTDAALLMSVVNVLFDEGLVAPDLGGIAEHVRGVERVAELAVDFPPDTVGAHCGLAASDIRVLARELAAAPRAAVYGRLGTSTVEFGTVGSWLVDVVNVLTGNLDRPGGVMFPLSPVEPARRGPAGRGKGFTVGRWRSRASGHPEVAGELPAAAMAEEIGAEAMKALVTVAGNPVLSAPNGAGLAEALDQLEFMVCVDPYLNETTRHADVVLPPPPPSRAAHFDVLLNNLAVRGNARYSPPVLGLPDGRPDEIELLSRLVLVAYGLGVHADPELVSEQVVTTMLSSATANPHSPVAGRDPEDLAAMLPETRGYERWLDAMLRLGPYGDGFGAREGLNLQTLKDSPHGIDLGPMRPRLPEVLRTPSGKVELAPEAVVADLERLRRQLAGARDSMLLIGRRHLRSNNSWMHNVPALMGGTNRCTMFVHPDDAIRLGLDGQARVIGDGGELVVPVEVTSDIRPGVVSLPHGWGHDQDGTRLRVAGETPGVNVNLLNDGSALDPLSGTAVLNGLPVRITPA